MEKQEERIMATYPIALTFKGILRIAHIQELNARDTLADDNFFNKTYYNSDWEKKFHLMNISGEPETGNDFAYSKALSAFEGKITRYNSTDVFVDKMLPVTDSVGNFLNFYVSPDGSLFGSDENNAGTTLKTFTGHQFDGRVLKNQSEIYPNLKSDKINVGIKYFPKGLKPIFSGQLNICDNLNTRVSEVIFYNNFDHTLGKSFTNIQYDNEEMTRANYQLNNSKNFRTIFSFSNDTPKQYDVLMHNQENYDVSNYALGGDKPNLDSYVDIVNLKEYIKERIDKYMAEMIIELPPGTVIWQYVDIKKWYGQTDDGTTDTGNGDDCLQFRGHAPAMIPSNESKTYTSTMFDKNYTNIGQEDVGDNSNVSINGVATKDISKMVKPNSIVEEDFTSNNQFVNTTKYNKLSASTVKEVLPAYKRNFVLCDGATYSIRLSEGSNDYFDITSFERLINLFYVIGFEYTNPTKARMWKYNILNDGVAARLGEKWEVEDIKKIGHFWKDAMYEKTMGAILAFKVLYNDIKSGGGHTLLNGKYNYETAKNWLKTKEIPEEFAFNTVFYKDDETHDGILYTYSDGSNSVKLNLGKEVMTFNDEIAYPLFNNYSYRIKLINSYEVDEILRYFDNKKVVDENNIQGVLVHSFQVPNFVDDNTGVGVFIGSSAAEAIYGDGGYSSYSSSSYNGDMEGHRHGLYIHDEESEGALKDNPDAYPVTFKNYGLKNDCSTGFKTRTPVSCKPKPDLVPECASYIIQDIRTKSHDEDSVDEMDHILKYVIDEETGVKKIVYAENLPSDKNAETIPDTKVFRVKFANGNEASIEKSLDPRALTMEPNRGVTSPPICEIEAGENSNIKYNWAAWTVSTDAANSTYSATKKLTIEYFAPESVQMLPLISL